MSKAFILNKDGKVTEVEEDLQGNKKERIIEVGQISDETIKNKFKNNHFFTSKIG